MAPEYNSRSRVAISRHGEELCGCVRSERMVLLFSLAASGQIKLRRIDGWRKIAAVLSQQTAVAA